ncbi:NAD(P)-dependent dehydrogenase (short-subunit alcohol dehydrogenase family) [Sphingopyxis panaciterrae]|uniref:SDR family NAD(P)-dependent oxidoreductase n=1 Tax=Sphingopyxis panaciterrae TaxID=363841 RepID=UPI0014247FC8|nr:SDR family NAD(P)-dependent oxidoreductase [Sphingopyxis panaciterrae]NIJ36811.1 NAD(P)-dependent dehydrogenase (short-subunit alcohol dehydrogenase family) [Sphingopyxis panaciterrae]
MTNLNEELAGQVALVTGASRGIGEAIAEALAARGAHVVITARTAGGLEELEDRIHNAGGSATIAPLDLTDGDSIARLAAAMAERWQKLDMLVLNAAMLGTLTPVAAIDGKEFNKLLTLNLIAQQALIANFDPLLRRAANGRLLALSSGVARDPRAYWGAYAASKAALETLVTSYGAEMRNISTVRTAILDPGGTRTQMRARAYPGEDPQSIKDPVAVGEFVANLMTEGFDSTAFHALPKVMADA